MRRLRLATLAAVLATFGTLAATARADDATDARATVNKFVTALLSSDAVGICNLMTPRAVTAFGGP